MILDFPFLVSRVRVCVRRLVGVCACVCRRRRVGVGARACLRFVGVQKRLIGEWKGQFQGSLFAGNVTGAEIDETAF